MWRELEEELRLKKEAKKEATKESAGKNWTDAQIKHRAKVLLRRQQEQKPR
ncbi:MAG TPA: hypothetical protein VG013_10455 [Gemmataceae bacterium]|jgi:hypothetical protein|nr:hypothetical protein [Gemmataceae bacterium]